MPDPFDPSSYDPTRKQQRRLDKLALQEELGRPGRATHNRNILQRTGLTDDQIDELLLAGGGQSDDALLRMSNRGGLAGRRAAAFSTRLGLQDLDEAAGLAESSAREDIAYSSGALADRLRGSLGPGFDPNSPSVAFLQQQHQLTRETALEGALRDIQTRLAEGKAAVRSGQLASLYTDIGDTVDALRAIREEEKALRGASIGNIVGGLTFNPWLGAAVGGSYGGTRGAVGGMQGGYNSLGFAVNAISALQGMGGGAGGGGAPSAPYGTHASMHDSLFPA